MRLITLRLGENTELHCQGCLLREDAECLAFCRDLEMDEKAYSYLRCGPCFAAERDHTQALRAARIDALESVGACDDMTGDRVEKELERLRKEVGDV